MLLLLCSVQEPIEEVSMQNIDLAKKVNDMQLQLEKLSDQNCKLMEMMETITHQDELDPEQSLMPGRDRPASKSPTLI